MTTSTVPIGQEDADSPTAFQTVAEVKARVVVKKRDLYSRIKRQETARTALGLLTFGGLATAGIGAAYGANTDLILAGVGGAGLAYGIGQLSTERGYDEAYLAGIVALNCIDATISPAAGSYAMLETRKTSLHGAITTLDGLLQDAWQIARSNPGSNSTKLKAAADTANAGREAADKIRSDAELRIAVQPDLANSILPALVAVDNQLSQQIMTRRPSLEQYFSVLQSVPGFGTGSLPGGSGAKLADAGGGAAPAPAPANGPKINSVLPAPPPPTDIDADTLARKTAAIASAVADMKNKAAIVDLLNSKISTAPASFNLAPCAFLAPDMVTADITFAPVSPAVVKPGTSQVIQIKGGGKNDAFSAVLQSSVTGLKVTPVGPRAILVEAAGSVAATYQVPVLVTGTFSGKSASLDLKGQ
ncbi:hypothetical protein [Ferrovibrio xuzhouensis]|uniref:Uncharacterized protein n=1 Tax=Ferrovibrio xuzhouensis TaxID=1576914 RepID=A0ABV7VES6_9PROT